MKKQDIIADYTVASLRKWVNVPDGGLLWTKEILKNDFFLSDLTFSEKRLEAQCMRNEFFCTGDIELKNRYRSIFATISNLLDSDVNPVKMSAYAYQKVLQTDWDMIYEQRKLNATELINKLKNNTNLKLIQKESGISDLYVPFNINERESVQQRLAALGIFNTIIWPLRDEQKKCCTVTKYIEEHMLAAPCDQRYRKKDMEYIAKEIERVLNE